MVMELWGAEYLAQPKLLHHGQHHEGQYVTLEPEWLVAESCADLLTLTGGL